MEAHASSPGLHCEMVLHEALAANQKNTMCKKKQWNQIVLSYMKRSAQICG